MIQVDSYPPEADTGSTPDPATFKDSIQGLFSFYLGGEFF